MAGAYPFLAEAGLGGEGIFVGQDAWSGGGFCFDPWTLYQQGVLTNPNCLLAGVVGKGKSSLAKSLATRSIAFGRRVYVPGDPKGDGGPLALGDRAEVRSASTQNSRPRGPSSQDPGLRPSSNDSARSSSSATSSVTCPVAPPFASESTTVAVATSSSGEGSAGSACLGSATGAASATRVARDMGGLGGTARTTGTDSAAFLPLSDAPRRFFGSSS